jgi:hypothetical protein
MTDQLKGCVVSFDRDIREDDAGLVLRAIEMLKGVQGVTPSLATPNDWMNRERVRRELGEKLWSILYPKESR